MGARNSPYYWTVPANAVATYIKSQKLPFDFDFIIDEWLFIAATCEAATFALAWV